MPKNKNRIQKYQMKYIYNTYLLDLLIYNY